MARTVSSCEAWFARMKCLVVAAIIKVFFIELAVARDGKVGLFAQSVLRVGDLAGRAHHACCSAAGVLIQPCRAFCALSALLLLRDEPGLTGAARLLCTSADGAREARRALG